MSQVQDDQGLAGAVQELIDSFQLRLDALAEKSDRHERELAALRQDIERSSSKPVHKDDGSGMLREYQASLVVLKKASEKHEQEMDTLRKRIETMGSPHVDEAPYPEKLYADIDLGGIELKTDLLAGSMDPKDYRIDDLFDKIIHMEKIQKRAATDWAAAIQQLIRRIWISEVRCEIGNQKIMTSLGKVDKEQEISSLLERELHTLTEQLEKAVIKHNLPKGLLEGLLLHRVERPDLNRVGSPRKPSKSSIGSVTSYFKGASKRQ